LLAAPNCASRCRNVNRFFAVPNCSSRCSNGNRLLVNMMLRKHRISTSVDGFSPPFCIQRECNFEERDPVIRAKETQGRRRNFRSQRRGEAWRLFPCWSLRSPMTGNQQQQDWRCLDGDRRLQTPHCRNPHSSSDLKVPQSRQLGFKHTFCQNVVPTKVCLSYFFV
jgi:hypothetical protein